MKASPNLPGAHNIVPILYHAYQLLQIAKLTSWVASLRQFAELVGALEQQICAQPHWPLFSQRQSTAPISVSRWTHPLPRFNHQ